jgi:hypothetical protein
MVEEGGAVMSEKLHYYNFTFINGGTIGGKSVTTYSSVRIGWPTEGVNEPRIAEAKQQLGLPADATPLAISYLGHMGKAVFMGDEPI